MNQSTELLLPEHISELHLALSGWRALSPLCFLVPAPEIVTVKQRCVHSSLCSEPCTNTHLFVPSGAKPLMRSFLLRAEQAEPSGLGHSWASPAAHTSPSVMTHAQRVSPFSFCSFHWLQVITCPADGTGCAVGFFTPHTGTGLKSLHTQNFNAAF